MCVTSPDDRLVQTLPDPGHDSVRVAPDGTVYSGDKVLQKDGTWTQWEYRVRDVRADGKLLVSRGHEWGIYNPPVG